MLISCFHSAPSLLYKQARNRSSERSTRFSSVKSGSFALCFILIGTKGKRKRKKCTFLFNPKAPMALVLSVVVLDLLGGSGDLVSRVMSKVAIVVSTYNPN